MTLTAYLGFAFVTAFPEHLCFGRGTIWYRGIRLLILAYVVTR